MLQKKNTYKARLKSESFNCIIAQYLNSVLERTGIKFHIDQKATETSNCNMCTHLQETGQRDNVVSVAHDECFFGCCHVCQEQLCWIDVAIWHLCFFSRYSYVHLTDLYSFAKNNYFFNCHRMKFTSEVSILKAEIVLQ